MLGSLNNELAGLRRNCMRNLTTKSPVQHHEHLQFFNIVDEDLAETVWQYVSGSLSVSVSDLRHLELALKASSDTVVDTMRLPPVRLKYSIEW